MLELEWFCELGGNKLRFLYGLIAGLCKWPIELVDEFIGVSGIIFALLPYWVDKLELELAEITLCFYFYLVDALFFYADSLCF